MSERLQRASSPREEGELEDGELSDDSVKADSPKPVRHRPVNHDSQYRHRPVWPPPMPHGYRHKDYRQPLRMQQQMQAVDNNQRSSFWERSHSTLGRFRSRGRVGRGGGGRIWDRSCGDRGVKPSSQRSWGEPSPRKPKTFGRSKFGHSQRNENCEEESFEDLLLKYKQIKLELETINKDEKLALSLKDDNVKEDSPVAVPVEPQAKEHKSIIADRVKTLPAEEKPVVKAFQAFELKPLRQKLKCVGEKKKQNVEESIQINETNKAAKSIQGPANLEETVSGDNNTNEINKNSSTTDESSKNSDATNEADKNNTTDDSNKNSNTPDENNKILVEEEEDLSELHLRLLALQSASKKWQQKEQLVMKESKEKLTKPNTESPKEKANAHSHLTKKSNNPAYAAKQALRRQQTKAWKKLQQQKAEEKRRKEEEEEKQKQAEEEKKKREEEIRKIRDLSNQEEQYNRFMKLVGDKATNKQRSKSLDTDLRRSDKQCVESAGGIYQYDNYEEVAMDTDSETNSPGASPAQLPYSSDSSVPSVLCVTDQFHSETWLSHSGITLYENILSCGTPDTPLPPPPLPPEEPEQPPKPPFADEEEEEEMLLREELLKSLATKRTSKPEAHTMNSQPASPVNPIMPVPRITLTSTNVNCTYRKTQLGRRPLTIRRVIKLPRHKSVVVTLNASDDSDSDGEPPSTNNVFGGLESMIKEARRTAEASKPKGPNSEKENDPMRTPEALPDDKKIEYRLLKEEIASREKQKLLKSDQSRISASPTNSDIELESVKCPVVTTNVTDAEAKHMKQTMLLVKDETILKHLLQQEAKKKESIKTAELKLARLSEQLQATEKLLSANKGFLKKLQEQITKVEHRVQEKRKLTLKYGEEFARAKALASRELGKRKLDDNSVIATKILKQDQRVKGNLKRHSAEAIAMEKKRLQQLEKEYALKIQKLKEMHARKVKEQPSPPVVEQPEFSLPQPSLHDLSQDKITLDIEENDIEDEVLSTSVKERRRSFRESSSFTKPNLKPTETTPNKENTSKPTMTEAEGPELFLGLNVEELRRLYSHTDNLKELVSSGASLLLPHDKISSGKELPVDVDLVTSQTKPVENKPMPFGPYRSPLLVFKSYRFSPYFRTKEKLLLSSVSYSNMIEPKTFFCRFDLTGTCNDDDCPWQHMRDCTLSRNQLFQDILSYNLDLIGCSEKSTDEEISAAAERYVDKLFGVNRDRMSMDQMAVLLVSYVNESRKHTPPHTTCKEKRKWRPVYWKKPMSDSSSSDEEETSKMINSKPKAKLLTQDAVVTPDDIRYFTNETDDISNLEASVLENPQDIQLWVKLTYKYLNQNEGTSTECLDSSLNVLSRALEHNRENPEIWSHYLKLFSKRGSGEEVQEMCEMAVEYAPSYQIWWTFLSLEKSFDGKDSVCNRTLMYLMNSLEDDQKSEVLSLQLLEILLYRVHLSLFTGRLQNALALLQNALKSPTEKSIGDYLSPQDRCLAWLSYIHLMEFSSLPAQFYDPTNANPARIVNKEPFLLSWLDSQSITTDPAMLLAVFEVAISSCTEENMNANEKAQVCFPLYKNMIALQILLNRYEAVIALCKQLLESFCCNVEIIEAFSSVYLKMDQPESAINVWLSAAQKNVGSAQILYYVCKFLCVQGHLDCIPTLIDEFVAFFFDDLNKEHKPIDLLRHLLNFSIPLNCKAPTVKADVSLEDLSVPTPYLWLLYCLWHSVYSSCGEAADAYEAALGAVMQQDVLQKLWMDYLIFTNSMVVRSKNKVQEIKRFADLVNRCLMTVPSRYPTPFSTDFWTNYEFHNSVIYFYLSCVPKAQHSKILERFSSMMPTNLGLALRVLKQELEENNLQLVKMQSKMFTYNFSMCLPIWKIAISVEASLKGHREVHHLYQRALQKLPLCAELWKDQLLFEASGGGKTDNLRKLVSKCREVGVSLDELLNLNTESRNH
ncbi:zinc finger C3H1 domain-containing protein isoform X2 [Bombina bombina]|uniref:zinc finger C3H1 domain-containing protein isoform X2 n=1 Tax=Bombina bombina TaxID=8345 RepID=UPI00235A505D|nr:zinc finger C3H1 domain-containing protein isoform X2 [Bombina bombina]